ncbi:MAG: hypothetical protein HWQ38_06530 [Nostoc sp. NMS7]|uniref:DUF6888 family protein n=1 Tax=uncultured Nostoc sp. TaxID=340711 RepID=UPI0035CBFEEF|nr:hypothetical protein [Nostoc sp. NMS7]
MQPTIEQLRSFYQMSVRMSNLLRPINLVRMDERTKRLVMLVGETIEIEIYPNGEVVTK